MVVPVTPTLPSRPGGAPPGAPENPDQFDTSAVPPIGLISLVSGIHLGSAPQIIVFLVIADLLLLGVILLASRRGRRLTRQSLEAPGTPDAGDPEG